MSVAYNYTISNTFAYGVNIATLGEEIRQSDITVALDFISSSEDTLTIYFKNILSDAEISILNTVLSNHDGRISPTDEVRANIPTGTIIQTNKKKARGANYRIYTHNFADKTTWYQYSEFVEGEQLTTSDNQTYSATHKYIINLYQPDMITREHWLLMPDGSFTTRWAFNPKVYINDVEQTDGFTIDYTNGTVTFDAPLSSTDIIKMDYYYATSSTFAIVPQVGKKILVYKAGLIANDVVSFDGHVIQLDIFAGDPTYAYPVGDARSPYNQFAFRYRSILDFVVAGDTCEKIELAMMTNPLIKISFDYDAVIELRSDQAAALYLSMSNDTPINTEIGIGTFQIEILNLAEDY